MHIYGRLCNLIHSIHLYTRRRWCHPNLTTAILALVVDLGEAQLREVFHHTSRTVKGIVDAQLFGSLTWAWTPWHCPWTKWLQNHPIDGSFWAISTSPCPKMHRNAPSKIELQPFIIVCGLYHPYWLDVHWPLKKTSSQTLRLLLPFQDTQQHRLGQKSMHGLHGLKMPVVELDV